MPAQRLEEVREIVADVLECEPAEISDLANFSEHYQADSVRAIEILSRLEKKYGIEIPQSMLPVMQNLQSVYNVVARIGGWQESRE